MDYPGGEPMTSPGAWQACAMSRSGLHRWEDNEAGTALLCSRCGLFAPPCHSTTGRHQWNDSTGRRGRGHRRCARCGLTRPRARGHGPVWRWRYARCVERDGPDCFYCGAEVTEAEAVLDHFVPRSAGGSDEAINRRIACRLCDQRKGVQFPWEFDPERFSSDDLPSHAWRERSA